MEMSAALDIQSAPGDAITEKLEALDIRKPEVQKGDLPPPYAEPSPVAASLREEPSGVRKTVFVDPYESAKPTSPPTLTEDQEAKYQSLLKTVKGWEEIPSKEKGGPIQESEIMWLTRECLLRYLRATKWNTVEATKRLLGTLVWRRDYGVDGLNDGKEVSPENETGKQIILGFDVSARPCLYLSPGRQNTEPSPRQVQHLVFAVERLVDLMIPGQETLALLINFKASKTRTNTAPGIGQGREVLNILQTHYPERLGRACIINVPWVVWGFFKLITPFIDPLTREKLKFNEDVGIYVPREQLWKEDFNGLVDFEYDHSVYWPALVKLCEERRAERKARWEKAGRRYGESEHLINGGAEAHVAQQAAERANSKLVPAEIEADVPTVTTGTESYGNSDVTALTADPKLTTEGDKS